MANNKIAYGIANANGIDTDGMTPKEVWAALAEKGIAVTYPQNTKYEEILQADKEDENKMSVKVRKTIKLPRQEYAELCSAIRTRHSNRIPNNGRLLYNNYFYMYNYNSNSCEIKFVHKIKIDGNEDIIANLEAKKW